MANENQDTNRTGREGRGFASMDPERQRQIASQGGKAAHAQGTAHEFTSDEAREAGRKGGQVVSQNREHMAEIGRRGGEARGAKATASRGGAGPHQGMHRPGGTGGVSGNIGNRGGGGGGGMSPRGSSESNIQGR